LTIPQSVLLRADQFTESHPSLSPSCAKLQLIPDHSAAVSPALLEQEEQKLRQSLGNLLPLFSKSLKVRPAPVQFLTQRQGELLRLIRLVQASLGSFGSLSEPLEVVKSALEHGSQGLPLREPPSELFTDSSRFNCRPYRRVGRARRPPRELGPPDEPAHDEETHAHDDESECRQCRPA
jgi:hypothetical protein